MATKEKQYSDIQQYEEGGRGLLVRGSDSEELRDILIAVYGTLKKGCGNNLLLADAVYVDDAKTYSAYPLVIHGSGLPFLVDKPGSGHKVTVELYLVNESELKRIDLLEGHPNWYERKKRRVTTTNGEVLLPYIYFAPAEYYSDETQTTYEAY